MPRRAANSAAVALSACLLTSCAAGPGQQAGSSVNAAVAAASVPLPGPALLKPQPAPACEAAKTSQDDGKAREGITAAPARLANLTDRAAQPDTTPQASAGGAQLAQADAGLAQRIKLEYERNCYRQAEQRTRQRLHALQAAVGRVIRAMRHVEREEP